MITSPITAISSAAKDTGKLSENRIWEDGGNSSVPLPQDHLDLISRINGKLISHISEFHRSAFHMIHYKPEIIQSVSIGKCKPFDTTSVKLSQVHFSPWHFPVSFKPASPTEAEPLIRKRMVRIFAVDHILQRITISSHLPHVLPGNPDM